MVGSGNVATVTGLSHTCMRVRVLCFINGWQSFQVDDGRRLREARQSEVKSMSEAAQAKAS